jgi:ABC-2 type transport system ATP-binding protein
MDTPPLSPTSLPIIDAQSVTKRFNGLTAVDGLTLQVPEGVIYGFVGPSGCGKTTSVRLLLGIEMPDEGEITVLGTDPQRFSRIHRGRIGYMPQQFVLYPELNVWENLNFAASLYGVGLRRSARLHELLDLVELTGHENKKVRDLSGGMQRRLGLAASIIHEPRLIFLDEPTAGIDPILRRKFWDYFERLRDAGHTLFVTTQYVSEAAYCDRVGVMAEGRLLMSETPDGLRRRALGGEIIHLHTARFLNPEEFTRLQGQPFVLERQASRLHDRGVALVVDSAGETLPVVMAWCQEQGIDVESASQYTPLFDDVFVELINQAIGRPEEARV